MKLDRIEIADFRSLKNVTIRLEPRCRVLVGINEAGKTNILSALSLLSPLVAFLKDDVRQPAPHEDLAVEPEVLFVFTLSREDRLHLYDAAKEAIYSPDPLVPLLIDGENTLSLAQLCDRFAEALYEVNATGFRGARYRDFMADYQIAEGWFKPSPTHQETESLKLTKERAPIPLKSLGLVHYDPFDLLDVEHLVPATARDVEDLVARALLRYTESNLPTCVLWRYSDEQLIPASIPLKTFAKNPETCIPLRNAFALAGVQEIDKTIEEAEDRSEVDPGFRTAC